MAYLLVEHCCDIECTPSRYPNNVSQNTHAFWLTYKHMAYAAYSRDCYLDIRLALGLPRLFRWTLPYTRRASPLRSDFFLNVKSNLIHPAPSLRSAHDHAIWHTSILRGPLKFRPLGVAGRVMLNSMVVRLRPFDGACKARFAVRGRTLKLFIARAMNSLLGSFDFRWGEKSSRIFEVLSQSKNQNSLSCAGAHSILCSAGAEHSSDKTSRLNALRVAERNFTCEAL